MQIELGPGIVGHEQDVPEAVVGEEEDQLKPAYVAGDPLEAGLEFRVAEGRGIDRVIERRKAEGFSDLFLSVPGLNNVEADNFFERAVVVAT